MSELPHTEVRKRTSLAGAAAVDGEAGAEWSVMAARYLTDGAHLYCNLGLLDGSRELVGLEDCMSLEVLLVCRDELRDRAFRAVEPALLNENVLAAPEREYS